MEEQVVRFDLAESATMLLVDRVAEHFLRQIWAGELRRGDFLPKSNSIAGISYVTMIKAYGGLNDEGLVQSVRARGTVVTADANLGSHVFLTASSTMNLNSFWINSFQQHYNEENLLEGRRSAPSRRGTGDLRRPRTCIANH